MKDKRRRILILPDKRQAYFHTWVKVRYLECDFDTYAIVEYQSGDVKYVRPTDILFYDWMELPHDAI